MGGYYKLAEAIVIQACNDYVKAYRKKDIYELENLKRFFNGSWFSMMYDIEGKYMIELLERKARNGREKTKRIYQKGIK